MIFLTVGTQLPFDRLVCAVDDYCESHKNVSVIGQIGSTMVKPANFESFSFVSARESDEYVRNSDFIISHAGTGTILKALEFRKPIIIMPRRASYKEHRNDHQLATVKWAEGLPGVFCANDRDELGELIGKLEVGVDIVPGMSSCAEQNLLNFITDFLTRTGFERK